MNSWVVAKRRFSGVFLRHTSHLPTFKLWSLDNDLHNILVFFSFHGSEVSQDVDASLSLFCAKHYFSFVHSFHWFGEVFWFVEVLWLCV